MPVEHPVKRVKAELRRRFRLAGKGSVSRVQKQLGLGKRYFRNQHRKSRQRFDLKVLFDALEALETDAAEFFAAVLGPADPVDAFRHEAAALLRGRKRPPRILVLERQRDPDTADTSSDVDFSDLDGLRYDDPKQVKRKAKKLIAEVDAAQVPRLLGCYASACRVEGKLDEAQIVLGRALDLAAERDDGGSFADLIQRAGCVVADRGDFESAYSLAERATLEYSRLGDVLGLGKSLIDQGMWLFCLRQYPQALGAYQAALKLFCNENTPEIRRYRFSCSMNAGIICRKSGDLHAAEAFALKARTDESAVGRVLVGNLAAFQASLAKTGGKNAMAAAFLRESIEAHTEVSPLDTAFSVVELCRLHLETGQCHKAYESAKLLLPLLDRLEKNPLASSYVTELLRCAVAGRGLTLELLDRVMQGMKKGRAAQPRRRACYKKS